MRLILSALVLGGLTACASDMNNHTVVGYYQPFPYVDSFAYSGETNVSYMNDLEEKPPLTVPDSYHVGTMGSPTPHTDLDKEWVDQQHATGYTIELADGDKASLVANTLLRAPKQERRAEISYQRAGKTYYKGVYGTYPTKEAAEQALKTLPAGVTGQIKPWGSVQ